MCGVAKSMVYIYAGVCMREGIGGAAGASRMHVETALVLCEVEWGASLIRALIHSE